ncbi:hypothetical protein DCC39_04570 [Pueribacillus theae]|uniref:Uncharacterized protein n=1 Tax=Pueribacillus theae TaxID=2171751 RepID=A0A2U1K6Y3_9BACI|nr:hypothetical protein [Pueribacillus theae]PWA12713.1 hypothetical protein DCC39_04570 [Pueribacillus theae]
MKFYVVGAQQKNQVLKDWEQYKKGIILEVDSANKTVEKRLDYVSPADVCPAVNPSISFTAATVDNNHLYVGTQTEVLTYSLPSFRRVGYLSLPCFNDIHHVRPTNKGNLLIVNTGLDMVLEVSPKGEILNVWNVLGKDPWERFSKTIDYRKVPTTKPHESHPNYVFNIGNDIWATRCHQKDAVCLSKPGQRIKIGRELVHDGVVYGGKIYFTQVDGHIVLADSNNLKVLKVHNLKKMTNTDHPLGWCRGIKVVNDHKVIVGFTRVRPSKIVTADGKEQWKGGYGVLPTRISCYDLKNETLLWEQSLENEGMNAVYSIHSKVI